MATKPLDLSSLVSDEVIKKTLFGSGTYTVASTAPAGEPLTAEKLYAMIAGFAAMAGASPAMDKFLSSVSSPTTVSAAPSWAATTVKWLRENGYGHYVPHAKPEINAKLAGALRRMSYRRAEADSVRMGRAEYEKWIDEFVAVWDLNHHRHLVEYLNKGGYVAEKARYGMDELDDALEEIRLERDDGVPPPTETVPVAKPPADEDLGEVVATLERRADPRNGSW